MRGAVVRRLLVTGRHGFVGNTLAPHGRVGAGACRLDACRCTSQFQILDPGRSAGTRRSRGAGRGDSPRRAEQRTRGLPRSGGNAAGQRARHAEPAASAEAAGFRGPMVYVGSGDVYGGVPEQAFRSTRRFPRPRNPYAVSKLAAEAFCYQWSVTEGMQVVSRGRSITSVPGRAINSSCPACRNRSPPFAEAGRRPELAVGDIDVTRDFTDVRDIVLAYFALLERGAPRRALQRLLGTGANREIDAGAVDRDCRRRDRDQGGPARMRPAEQRAHVRKRAQRCISATGWRTRTPIEQSLADILELLGTRRGRRMRKGTHHRRHRSGWRLSGASCCWKRATTSPGCSPGGAPTRSGDCASSASSAGSGWSTAISATSPRSCARLQASKPARSTTSARRASWRRPGASRC